METKVIFARIVNVVVSLALIGAGIFFIIQVFMDAIRKIPQTDIEHIVASVLFLVGLVLIVYGIVWVLEWSSKNAKWRG